MTAFDRAWDLVKMPILPNTVKRRTYQPNEDWNYDWIGGGDEPMIQYDAQFLDPVSNEVLPMQLNMEGDSNERVLAQIKTKEKDRMTDEEIEDDFYGGTRAFAYARSDLDSLDGDSGNYKARNLETREEYRRRGYATALYDLIAYALKHHKDGFGFLPDSPNMQSEEASEMWGGRDKWPVRDDL